MESEVDIKNILSTFIYNDENLYRLFRGKYKKVEIRKNDGKYSCVQCCGKKMLSHRVIWIINKGPIPKGMQIDHINGNHIDNRINNLRIVLPRENSQNFPKHREGHLVGTSFDSKRNKWISQIRIKGATNFLGYFETKEEAHKAYMARYSQMRCFPKDSQLERH